MIRFLYLTFALILVGCVPHGDSFDVRDTTGFYSQTLDVSYDRLTQRHVTDLDMAAFNAAGFAALGFRNIRLDDPNDGKKAGEALAYLIASSGNLQSHHPQDLIERFIEAGLDATRGDIRFTAYLNPDELNGLVKILQGGAGVGIQLERHTRGLIIRAVRPESPAQRAGIVPNDLILEVNGQSLQQFATLEERALTLKGKAGSKVTLLLHTAAGPREVQLTRVPQTINQFQPEKRIGNVGYIPLRVFDNTAASHVYRAYNRLQRSGDLEGVILDFRDNSGGSVSQAQQILDLFLPTGTPLFIFGSDRGQQTWQAQNRVAVPENLPLIVLMNGNSASASELVAAGLKDSGRALILGSSSFGKGSQQAIESLPNGGALAITTDFLFRLDGRRLSHRGIAPHVCAAQFSNAQQLINAAQQGRLSDLREKTKPGSSVRQARRACPANISTNNPGHDIRLSLGLISNQEAFQAALF